MADSTSQPLLPPFALRDLNGSEAPPAVVQVTAVQYDHTIQSTPEAALIYMDDDDGESITIGSSFELEQRLDEPAMHSTVPVPLALKTDPEADDKMMHIFDIQHTTKALSLWKDHQAETNKKMSLRAASANVCDDEPSTGKGLVHPNEDTTSSSKGRLEEPPATSEQVSSGLKPTESKSGQPEKEGSTVLETSERKIATDLGSHLGIVANFLEATARVLRKGAGKATEAEPSPEFLAVLSDVKEVGLKLLKAVDRAVVEHNLKSVREVATSACKPAGPSPSSTSSPTAGETKVPVTANKNAKRVTFQPDNKPNPSATLTPAETRAIFDTYNLFHGHSAQMPGLNPWCMGSYLSPRTTHPDVTNALRPELIRPSILDLEPLEPDFSARYPPLLSLRKAKSVSGLHNKPQFPSSSGRTGINAASALTRYPSIDQFEQQTRLRTRARVENTHTKNNTAASTNLVHSAPEPKKTCVYKKASVEDDTESQQLGKANDKDKAVGKEKSPVLPLASVPGAWPEQKSEESYPAAAAYQPSSCSNAPGKSALSYRDTYPVSSLNAHATTASLPRRYHTVDGTSPAARLNGPFDPLAPLGSASMGTPAKSAYAPDWMPSWEDYKNVDSTAFKPSNLTAGGGQSQPGLGKSLFPSKRSSPVQDPGARIDEALARAQGTGARYRYVTGPYPHLTRTRPRYWEPFRPGHEAVSARPFVPRPLIHPIGFDLAPTLSAQAASPQSKHSGATQPRTKNISVDPAGSSTSSTPSVVARKASLSPIIIPTPYTRPRGRSGASAPPPTSTTAIDQCVKTLKTMGYGTEDDNELSRLNIYASAAAGDIEAAIEMIEEERQATKELAERRASPDISDVSDVSEREVPGRVEEV